MSCGINGSQVGTTTVTATGGSFVCTFPDGPANSTVSVQVKDSDLANSNTDTQVVVVANVPPVITSSPGLRDDSPDVHSGQRVANFSDLGTGDTHTCMIGWDNGSGPMTGVVTESNGSGACTGNLTTPLPGSTRSG